MRVPIDILRCPTHGAMLFEEGATLRCAAGHFFPVVDGAPVLIDDEASIFTVSAVAASRSAPRRPGLIERIARRLSPHPSSNTRAASRFARCRDLLCEEGRRAHVLVVGGGELGHGMDVVACDPRLQLIATDVYLSDTVDVACDAHQLPFVDGAFDGVIVQAVLEHVASPPDVVAEIHRVLRAGGIVYAETPFLQAVHEGAYDFTRFTDVGHRRLFRMFEEIDRGVALGPATSLLWAIRYFFRAIPRHGGFAARLLGFAATYPFFWLVYLDRWLSTHAGAFDAASGVYFLGRRAERAVSDREIVESYRGTTGRAAAKHRGLSRVSTIAPVRRRP